MHDLLTKCITKIVGTTIDDAEDLDLVMRMYKLFLNNRSKDEVKSVYWNKFKTECENKNTANEYKSHFVVGNILFTLVYLMEAMI